MNYTLLNSNIYLLECLYIIVFIYIYIFTNNDNNIKI